jgi:hypothetical protein
MPFFLQKIQTLKLVSIEEASQTLWTVWSYSHWKAHGIWYQLHRNFLAGPLAETV